MVADEDAATVISEPLRPTRLNLNDGLPSWAKPGGGGEAKGAMTPTQDAVMRPGGRWADKDAIRASFTPTDLIARAVEAIPTSRQSPIPSVAFEISADSLKRPQPKSSGLSRPSSPGLFQQRNASAGSGQASPLTTHDPASRDAEERGDDELRGSQPSIFGFLGKKRRPVRDELDDDEDDDGKGGNARAPPSTTDLLRSASQTDAIVVG